MDNTRRGPTGAFMALLGICALALVVLILYGVASSNPELVKQIMNIPAEQTGGEGGYGEGGFGEGDFGYGEGSLDDGMFVDDSGNMTGADGSMTPADAGISGAKDAIGTSDAGISGAKDAIGTSDGGTSYTGGTVAVG